MGYQDSNHKFVSELTSAEIKECRNRAAWLAEHWFTQSDFRTIDLDETPTYGKIHAIVGESYSNNELRIRFMTEANWTLFTARFTLASGQFELRSYAAWVGKKDRHRGSVYVNFRSIEQFANQYITYLQRGEVGQMWGVDQARVENEAMRQKRAVEAVR